MDALDGRGVEIARSGFERDIGDLQDVGNHLGSQAGEVILERGGDVPLGRVLKHSHQPAQFDAVGVRLDLLRLFGKLVDRALVGGGLLPGRRIEHAAVRVGERGLLDIVIHAATALLVARLELDLNPGAVLLLPLGLFFLEHERLVLAGVDRDFEQMRDGLRRGARDDGDGLAGGELAVHAGGRHADALLAALLLEPVELRTVEELAEDLRDLRLYDSRTVVLDRNPETLFRQLADFDAKLRENPRLFAGVKRIVDALAHRSEKRLLLVVEPEKVTVLDEELGDRDLALLLGEAFGGGAARRNLAHRLFGRPRRIKVNRRGRRSAREGRDGRLVDDPCIKQRGLRILGAGVLL